VRGQGVLGKTKKTNQTVKTHVTETRSTEAREGKCFATGKGHDRKSAGKGDHARKGRPNKRKQCRRGMPPSGKPVGRKHKHRT